MVLLNSGGLDSALVAKALKRLGHEVHSLHIDAGSINHLQTRAAAQTTADKYCASHHVMTLDFGHTPNSWVVPAVPVPPVGMTPGDYVMWDDVADPAAKYASEPTWHFKSLPSTDILMFALGTAYAKMLYINQVYTGHRVNIDEQYLLAFDNIVEMNRHRSDRPKLKMPLADYTSYRDAIENGLGIAMTPAKWDALRAELAYTHSCRWDVPCGVCDKCIGRTTIGM
jgi:7-cyano-7-deazaguanine synthase in queuosine biosynthesis